MIIDITGTELTPGNHGRDCLGNGKHFYENGKPIECCCDECNYMLCCFKVNNSNGCYDCDDELCPQKKVRP